MKLLKSKRTGLSFLIAFGLMLAPAVSSAHAVGADAYVNQDGKSIVVEAWLGQGEVPQGGRVTVLRPDGSVYKEGKLSEGRWSFTPEAAVAYKFVVDLGNGHGKTFTLHPDELAKLGHVTAEAGARTPNPDVFHHGPAKDIWLKALVGLLVIGQIATLMMLARLRREVEQLKGSAKTDG